MTHMYMSSTKRVTPTSIAEQNSNWHSRELSGPSITSNENFSSKLIAYDTFEKKSAQQLLYESAQDRSCDRYVVNKKWETFTSEVDNHIHSEKYSKHLVNNLDDTNEWAALHYAVLNNNTYVCDQLTDKGFGQKRFQCDINILTGNGENVLHIAAGSNFLWQTPPSSSHSIEAIVAIDEDEVRLPAIIPTLIDRGADVNHADDEGRTPLHLAVMENRLTLVKYLLKRKANIYAKSKLYCNVLHFTFIPGEQTQLQLYDMFEYITKKIKSSTTEWNFSWEDKQINLALMRTLDNRTPLTLAACHPNVTENIIGNLLYDIINSSEKFHVYQTQICIAIEQVARRRLQNHDHLRPIGEVCNANLFNQLFHFPCRYNNVNLLNWLIEQSLKLNNRTTPRTGASKKLYLNEPDHAGYTPLLTAVFYGSIDCVKYLLRYPSSSARTDTTMPSLSININQQNSDGENILHICAKHHVPDDLFDIIWDSAAKWGLPEKSDNNGNLPLHVAAGNNQEYMCDKFLTGFEWSTHPLSVRNNQGQTAAHVATEAVPPRIGPERHYIVKHEKDKHHDQEGSKEEDDDKHDFGLPILKLMCALTKKNGRHSGLFERDDDRKTCLHLAAAKGHMKIVEFLVKEVRFEIDPIADQRLTPLHLACENGHGEIVAYLIENGASATFRNAELYNSLEIAIINQNKKVVEELLTLPNWRELMRNAQPIHNSEAYDTPMRKLIRYLPQVTVWLIETNLTRSFGGQGKHVFKKVYDYEFYMDVYQIKKWYSQSKQSSIRVV